MNKVYLSVIIPCFNEEKNLERGVLGEVDTYLKKQKYESEVVVSDDGSTDGSLGILNKFAKGHSRFKILKNIHAGKPFAVRSGVLSAKGEIVLFSDMDQSTPIGEVEKIIPFFSQNYDVVIGSRGTERKNFAWYRKLMSKVFFGLRRLIILSEIKDTQCGFKAFRRRAGEKIFSKMLVFASQSRAKGWTVGAWDVEMLFIAKKLGFKIKEVVVDWQSRDFSTSKKQNFIKESREMLGQVFRTRLNDLRGFYE